MLHREGQAGKHLLSVLATRFAPRTATDGGAFGHSRSDSSSGCKRTRDAPIFDYGASCAHSTLFHARWRAASSWAALLKKSPHQRPKQRLASQNDGLKLHVIAQTGELANEALLRSFPIPFFKEGLPFLQIGGLVPEERRENDQDAVSDGHCRSFGPSTPADTAIVFSQVTVLLMRSRMSSLHEQTSYPGMAFACLAGKSLTCPFVLAWAVE